jgi:hypothetical protein
MPDTTDHVETADLLARIADDVRVINQPVVAASGPDVLSGGRLGTALETFLADRSTACRSIADELEAGAAEARALAAEALVGAVQ